MTERSVMSIGDREVLVEEHEFEFPYERSVGHVIGGFLAGLKERRLLGVRTDDGRVLVPPTEYDPDTAAELTELVPVGDAGVVTAWSWVVEPRPLHPLDQPFAWALIKLDGADTAMLHAVATEDRALMATGMRVQASWRDETAGAITDIACFVPEADQ